MSAKERVINRLRELCGAEEIEEKDTLLGDLNLDSLNMVILLVELEEDFGICLEESDMNPYDLITVSDVIALAEKYGGK